MNTATEMYSINSPVKKRSWIDRIKNLFASSGVSSNSNIAVEDFGYKNIIEKLPLLICVKNKEGQYQMVNQAFVDLVGKDRDEILGKDDAELGLFLNPEQIMVADQLVFDSSQKKYIPLEPFTDRYGALYWFQTTKFPLLDESGAVKELLIISSDITQKIEVEQRLSKSELRYKSIFENNYSGIIVVDNELNIHNKNKAFNKLVESSQKTLNRDDLKKYISSEDRTDLIDLMMGMVSRNYESFDLNLELNLKSGNKVDTICFVRGLYDESGNFTEAVVTFQDITKENKNLKALEESENRFRIIVENATEALLLLDFENRCYIDANKNAEGMFGYTKEELLSLKLGDLSPLNQASGENSANLSAQYMQQAIDGENVVYEWIVRRKDGKLIPCEVRLVKLPYEDKTIVRTSVIDITERKRNERLLNLEKQKLQNTNNELVDLNHKLEDQTQQLQEFAYISSHNLRSPAGNIRALLDFYNSDPTKENFDLFLDKLDVVSVDLMETINDLADVVKIKNEVSKEVSVLSLSKIVDKIKDSLSEKIKSKNAIIRTDFKKEDKIKASKTYMESIFLNLISNALKYSKDEVPPEIDVSSKIVDSNLVLTFKDNGLGIDLTKFGGKVFGLRKTFHRNKDSRGVGLFITKAQVEAMGGTIDIESEPNVGTTFVIKIPKDKIL
ncbi:MAG: PAS domain S-box protein [Bacteroidia bacterium]|nr:PAS domain S-box protein [Bacteroidia bacterium]